MKRILTRAAVVLTAGLLSLPPSALAQRDCKAVEADFVDVCFSGPSCSGTITNGGILNGTTVTVFTGGPSATPSPTTSSFSLDITITTNQGQLKTSHVNLFDGSLATSLGKVNPTTSTGRFAGATGVLFTSGKVVSFSPFTVKLGVTGEICLVKE